MTQRLTLSVLIALLTLGLVAPHTASAQVDESNIPLFARFCTNTRAALGDEVLLDEFAFTEEQISEVEGFLIEYDLGNRTVLEGLNLSQQLIETRDSRPQVPCLAPAYNLIYRIYHELQIAMLYGQLTDTDNAADYLDRVRARLEQLRGETTAAIDYVLTQPAVVAAQPTESPPLEATTPDEEQPLVPGEGLPPVEDTVARSSEDLSRQLSEYLLNNGVVVLVDASVQVLEDEVLIRVQLDSFTDADGRTYDRENTFFTYDRVGELLATWPEVANVSRIAIETFDETIRTLYAESSGQNFRDYYINGSISQAQFSENLLIRDLSEE